MATGDPFLQNQFTQAQSSGLLGSIGQGIGSLGGSHSSRDLRTPFGRICSAGKQNAWQPKTCFILHERTSRYVRILI